MTIHLNYCWPGRFHLIARKELEAHNLFYVTFWFFRWRLHFSKGALT